LQKRDNKNDRFGGAKYDLDPLLQSAQAETLGMGKTEINHIILQKR
jgi:hypothetical protein